MLGQLEAGRRAVIADLEAGIGTLTRMTEGSIDLVLLVTEPSAKAIEVTRRAREIIAERKIGPTLVVANRVRDQADLDRIRTALGEAELIAVPEDPAVLQADRDAVSPIDATPDSPAVRALAALARRFSEPHWRRA